MVEMLRGGDDDGVDGLVGEEFFVVDVGLGSVLTFGLDEILGMGEVAGVGVTDGLDLEAAAAACVGALG